MTDAPEDTAAGERVSFGDVELAAAYKVRDFLHRSGVPFEWIELKDDKQARQVGASGTNREMISHIEIKMRRVSAPTSAPDRKQVVLQNYFRNKLKEVVMATAKSQ